MQGSIQVTSDFYEEQRFRQPWLWIVLTLSLVLPIAIPLGLVPGFRNAWGIVGTIVFVEGVFLLLFWRMGLITSVTPEGSWRALRSSPPTTPRCCSPTRA
jgi:hypothetical protein